MSIKVETKNELLIGSAAGILASLPKYVFHELFQLAGLTKFDNNWTAFGVILDNYSHTTANVLLAFLTAVIIGAFWGVILAFLFSKVFTKHMYLLKGALFGIGIWLLNLGILAPTFFRYSTALREDVGIAISLLIGLAIYGVFTAYFLERFGIFSENQGLR